MSEKKNWWDGMKFEKSPLPRDTKFTIREWAWGLFAYARFWNKKFHAPYVGLNYRQCMILMCLRGQRPVTVEELMSSVGEKAVSDVYEPAPIATPRVSVGRFNATGLTSWESSDEDPNRGASIIRKP